MKCVGVSWDGLEEGSCFIEVKPPGIASSNMAGPGMNLVSETCCSPRPATPPFPSSIAAYRSATGDRS
jgi:hypothetical protein